MSGQQELIHIQNNLHICCAVHTWKAVHTQLTSICLSESAKFTFVAKGSHAAYPFYKDHNNFLCTFYAHTHTHTHTQNIYVRCVCVNVQNLLKKNIQQQCVNVQEFKKKYIYIQQQTTWQGEKKHTMFSVCQLFSSEVMFMDKSCDCAPHNE